MPNEIPSDHWLNSGSMATDDAAIVALFRDWHAAFEASRSSTDRSDAEVVAADDGLLEIEHRIIETPTEGAPGLAIKALLAAINERGPDGEVLNRALLSLVDHGRRLVPELAPLADELLAATEKYLQSAAPDPEEAIRRAATLRARAAALTAEYRGPLPGGDAGLIEAGRRQAALSKGLSALSKEFEVTADEENDILNAGLDDYDGTTAPIEPVSPGVAEQELWYFIVGTAPEGPAGIVVKLHLLRSFDDGGPSETAERVILGQCIDATTRLGGSSDGR